MPPTVRWPLAAELLLAGLALSCQTAAPAPQPRACPALYDEQVERAAAAGLPLIQDLERQPLGQLAIASDGTRVRFIYFTYTADASDYLAAEAGWTAHGPCSMPRDQYWLLLKDVVIAPPTEEARK